jgi:transcriptional regulator with XRE-family HTH domain
MDELKLTIASNIIKLRTAAGMTQAELGEKLNYSDKTISKWERAEALPDVLVLKQIAGLFHISLDDLLNTSGTWENPKNEAHKSAGGRYSSSAITLIAITGIWTIALLIFVVYWMLGSIHWTIFIYTIPVSLVTHLVLNSIWNRGKYNLYIVSALVFSIISVIYIAFLKHRPWQLFLVAIPAEIIVYLSFRIKKSRKQHESTDRRIG